MEEKRIAREKAEKAANELQKMARAATVIQVIALSYLLACEIFPIKNKEINILLVYIFVFWQSFHWICIAEENFSAANFHALVVTQR